MNILNGFDNDFEITSDEYYAKKMLRHALFVEPK
jgi:hypothetical protein